MSGSFYFHLPSDKIADVCLFVRIKSAFMNSVSTEIVWLLRGNRFYETGFVGRQSIGETVGSGLTVLKSSKSVCKTGCLSPCW